MKIYVTVYTKEKGKLELTKSQWRNLDVSFLTYHREGEPAIEFANSKHWYINGIAHRDDGPAIEYPSGAKYWLINGREYSETDFNKLLKKVDRLEPVLGLTDPRDWVRKRFERKYKE